MSDADRVRELLDREEIKERKHAYLRAADSCDPDRMVADFVTEGFTASYDPAGPAIVGREAIRQWYRDRLGSVVASSHHVSNFEISFGDEPGRETAVSRCYLYSWQRFADHPATADRHRLGRYTDQWIRLDGAWQQLSLTLVVAGEFSDDPPRIAEHLAWDR